MFLAPKALQDRLIQKQSKLNNLKEEIDRMSEFKVGYLPGSFKVYDLFVK